MAELRASHEDRDRVSEVLRRHCVEGRLTTDELEERLLAAYNAKTLAELDAITEDLPASAPMRSAREQKTALAGWIREELNKPWTSWKVLFVIFVAPVLVPLWAIDEVRQTDWPVGRKVVAIAAILAALLLLRVR